MANKLKLYLRSSFFFSHLFIINIIILTYLLLIINQRLSPVIGCEKNDEENNNHNVLYDHHYQKEKDLILVQTEKKKIQLPIQALNGSCTTELECGSNAICEMKTNTCQCLFGFLPEVTFRKTLDKKNVHSTSSQRQNFHCQLFSCDHTDQCIEHFSEYGLCLLGSQQHGLCFCSPDIAILEPATQRCISKRQLFINQLDKLFMLILICFMFILIGLMLAITRNGYQRLV